SPGARSNLKTVSYRRGSLSETGMTFSEWRRNMRLIAAVERLEKGEDVTNVALSVGYNSLSAFIEMFKKALGVPPGAYQRSKTNGRAQPDLRTETAGIPERQKRFCGNPLQGNWGRLPRQWL